MSIMLELFSIINSYYGAIIKALISLLIEGIYINYCSRKRNSSI